MVASFRWPAWFLLAGVLSAPGLATTNGYAVHLASNERGFSQTELDALRASALDPYVTVYETENGVSYLLRAGGYQTMTEAFVALQGIKADYPKAWIVAVDEDEEHARSAEAQAGVPANVPQTLQSESVAAGASASSAQGLLAEADRAAANGNYDQAVRLYTKAMRVGDATQRRKALELLAVAREYKGQGAHAKALYEQYLTEYPDLPDSERVEQRLAALVTRDLPMHAARDPRRRASGWSGRGMFSQYYRRYAYSMDGADEVVSIDALFSDLDFDVRRRQEGFDVSLRVSGSHIYDFEDGESTFRLSGARVDLDMAEPNISVRAGRQSRHAAGILGRFDGVFIDVGVTPWLSIGAVGGYAVRSSFDSPNTDRPFYGASVTLVDPSERWQIEPFVIEQRANGLTDRRAVGAETRYFGERLTVFNLLDYDIYHEVLNNVHLIGHFNLTDGWRLHGSYDHRRSPYLTTQNALIGQGLDDLTELEREYADQEILDLAEDRTATADLANLGVNHYFGDRYLVGFDVSYSDYSATDASGDVPATPARTDVYYMSQFRADDAFGAGSFASVQLRYADGETADVYSGYLTTRFPLTGNVRLYPRLRYDYRDYLLTGQTQTRWLPSLRLEYRRPRLFNLELEVGYEWTRRELSTTDLDVTGYYVRAGYRSQF